MRILIQRVKQASVTISGKIKSKIDTGLLILVGIEEADTKEDAEWLEKKATSLRIFDDENGIMNRSVKDIGGSVLIVSQFTLHQPKKEIVPHISKRQNTSMQYLCTKPYVTTQNKKSENP